MAKTEGYSRYACDVHGCSNAAFAQDGTATAQSFEVRRRYDSDGVERSTMYCPDHARSYDKLAAVCDGLYEAFERGEAAVAYTQADMDAKQAEYDEIDKKYQWWAKKAKESKAALQQLQSEFDAYKQAHPESDGGDGE